MTSDLAEYHIVMPPCRRSPWCECGTRYDGRSIIFCDKHPPLNVIETRLAREIYVNGRRWSLQESTENAHSTERTESQQREQEKDMAQRISHTTPSSPIDQQEPQATVDDMVTQAPEDIPDFVDYTRDGELSIPSDLADVEVASDLVDSAPIMSPESEWDDFEDDFTVNSDSNQNDVEIYHTAPNSPIDSMQFFANQTTYDDIEEFVAELPRHMLTSGQDDMHQNRTAIHWIPQPSPRQAQLLTNQSTGK